MSDPSPLVGLTSDAADEAIGRLEAKIKEQKDSLKAAEAHLKEMKAARKNLTEPEPTGDGVVAAAGTAEVGVEAVTP